MRAMQRPLDEHLLYKIVYRVDQRYSHRQVHLVFYPTEQNETFHRLLKVNDLPFQDCK